MKNIFLLLLIFVTTQLQSQELYVFTEPASNMPANSIGLRLNGKLSKMNHHNRWDSWRFNPEIMVGVNKKLMVHLSGYSSNMFQKKYRFEGGGIYAKYRVHSEDDIHRHFRLAVFGKLALVNNPVLRTDFSLHAVPDGSGGVIYHEIETASRSYEIDLDGEVSGVGTGLIATQLIQRLAVSGTLGYNYRLNNLKSKKESFQPSHGLNWSASAGYLVLPKEYVSYRQTNMNVYLEMLGYNSVDGIGPYIDAAPAVQFIFNSIARLDFGYRTQLTGKGNRFSNSSFTVKFEYDILNVIKKKDK